MAALFGRPFLAAGDDRDVVRETEIVEFDLAAGDVFVFCTDGVSEANDALGREFGAERLLTVVAETRARAAREIVDAIFDAVQDFRGDTPPNDDMTAVVLKMTG